MKQNFIEKKKRKKKIQLATSGLARRRTKGANPFPTKDLFLSCRLQSFQSTGRNRNLIVTQISRQLWHTMIGYSLGSLSRKPMVGNREVYMTRMCEIKSSSKIFTGIMF